MWPMRSIAARDVAAVRRSTAGSSAAVEVPRQDLAVQPRRRRVRRRRARPASASGPGCISASHSTSAPSAAPASTASQAGHSTAPPLGTRWPSSRAGNTCVLFSDQQIAGAQVIRRAARTCVCSTRPVVAIEHEQARAAARRRRLLRDQLIRQLEVEVGDVHPVIDVAQPHPWPSSCTRPEACTTSSSSAAGPPA